MSDTPRTDAELERLLRMRYHESPQRCPTVGADFARQLEQELSEAVAAAWREGYAIGYTNGSNAARAYERGQGATSAGLEREAEWQHSDTRAALDARTKETL